MPTMSDTDLPDDLLPFSAAVRLVPSPRPGRGTHLSTIYRWCNTGRLRFWRQGRWRYVSRSELLALIRPAGPKRKTAVGPGPAEEAARNQAWAEEVLRQAGI